MFIALLRRLLLLLAVTAGPAFGDDALLWFEAGRPTVQAAQATAVLESAADQGLQPDDYHAAALARLVARARLDPPLAPAAQSALDGALTTALQRYLVDLRDGRVDPRALHADFDVPRRAPLDTLSFVRIGAGRAAAGPGARTGAAAIADVRGFARCAGPLPRLGRPPCMAVTVACAAWPQGGARTGLCGDRDAGAAIESVGRPGRRRASDRAARRPARARAAGIPGAPRARPGRRARPVDASTTERPAGGARAPDRARARAPALDALPSGAADDRGERARVRAARLRGARWQGGRAPHDEGDRRQGASHAHAAFRRDAALHRVQPLLERAAFHRARRSRAAAAPRPRLLRARRLRIRDRQRPGDHHAFARSPRGGACTRAGASGSGPAPGTRWATSSSCFPTATTSTFTTRPPCSCSSATGATSAMAASAWSRPWRSRSSCSATTPPGPKKPSARRWPRVESHTVRLAQPLPVLIAYSTVLVKGGRVFFFPDLYGHDRLLDAALRQRTAATPPLPLSLAGAQ